MFGGEVTLCRANSLSPDLLKQGVSVSAIAEHLSQTGYQGTDEPDSRAK